MGLFFFFLLIHSATLPFDWIHLHLITDTHVLIAILVTVLGCFYSSFLFLSFVLL